MIYRYADIAFADQYVVDYMASDPTWASSTEAEKLSALSVATQHLDLTYGAVWKGRRTQTDQPRDWPRYGVRDRDGFYIESRVIPTLLRQATVEVAVRHRKGVPLMPDVAAADVGIKRIKKVGEGVGEKEIEFAGSGSQSTAVLMGKVDALLATLVYNYGGGIGRVVRGG